MHQDAEQGGRFVLIPDPAYAPVALADLRFADFVRRSNEGVPAAVALERENGAATRIDCRVFLGPIGGRRPTTPSCSVA